MSTTSSSAPASGSDSPQAASPPFPLTAVQRTLLLDPYIAKRVVSCCVEITPHLPPEYILDAVGRVLHAHQGLTTRMHAGPTDEAAATGWLQAPSPATAEEIVEVRPHSTDPTHVIVGRELDALRRGTFDPRESLPTRGTLTPVDDGAVLVLAAHHLVMDALSRPIIVESLDRALRGEELTPAPPPDGIRGVVEREQATGARSPAAAAIDAVEQALTAAQPYDLDHHEVDRDRPAARVSFYLTRPQYEAFHEARTRLGVTSYIALVSGFLIELASRGRSTRPAVMTVRTRRVGRVLRSLVGTFADGIVLVPPEPVGSSTTVASIARNIGSTLFRGLAAKDNLVDLLPLSPSLQRYLGGSVGPVVAFQYLDISPPVLIGTGPHARLWYRADTEINFDGMGIETLHIICTDHGDAMEIAAWHPPGAFSEDTVRDLLEGFVARALRPTEVPRST